MTGGRIFEGVKSAVAAAISEAGGRKKMRLTENRERATIIHHDLMGGHETDAAAAPHAYCRLEPVVIRGEGPKGAAAAASRSQVATLRASRRVHSWPIGDRPRSMGGEPH